MEAIGASDPGKPHLSRDHTAFRAIIAANWRPHDVRRLYVEACRPATARILARGDAGLHFLQVWHYCVLAGNLLQQARWHHLAVCADCRTNR